MKDIGGIGIWALSYDAGSKKLWNKLKEKFTNCGDSPVKVQSLTWVVHLVIIMIMIISHLQ